MSDKKEFSYEIGDNQYTQQALVWGQVKQLKNLLAGTKFEGDLDVMSIIDALEDKMPKAIAIVLRQPDTKLKEKNIDDLAEVFEEDLELETMVNVVEDFFLCNRMGLLLQKISKVFGSLTGSIDLTSLTEQLQVSPEEISPGAKRSSGDSHQKSADLSQKSVKKK